MCCFSLNTLINVMYRLVIDMNSYNIHSSRLSPFNLILMMTRMDPNGLRLGVPDRAERISLDYGTVRRLHHLGIFGRKETKRETRNSIRFGVQLH